jgi:hypothetical protein
MKIQAIYRGKCDANYNASHCESERKAPDARTGRNRGKTEAENNGNRQKYRRVANVRL